MAQTPKENPVDNPKPHSKGRFQPGVSGNPGGLSQKRRLTNALNKKLAEKDIDNLADVLISCALTGSIQHIKELYDRLEGKAAMADEDREAMRPSGTGVSALQELYGLPAVKGEGEPN